MGFYMIGLIWTAYVLTDHQLQLWETIGFPLMYIAYLTYAIVAEKTQLAPAAPEGTWRRKVQRWFSHDRNGEKLPLVAKSAEEVDEESWNVDYYEGVHPGIIKALSRYENLKAHTESLEHANVRPGSWAHTFSRMDIWDTHEGLPWKRKSTLAKIVVVLQMPLRIVLSLSTPVVFYEDLTLAWDKRLHMLMAFFSFPIIIALVEEDAFYWKFSQEAILPSMAIGMAVGSCCAYLVHRTSTVGEPPVYNNMFAILGFTVALVFIYAISEEIVSIIRSFGLMWGIPTSIVAMAILGAGNGTCDLVSNYIIASQGRPKIAIGAVYGAPVLNLFIGVTVMGVIGAFNYGLPYPIESDSQIFTGLGIIIVALIPAMISSYYGQLTANTAKFLFGLYTMFIVVSLLSLFLV